ncbi:cache domain-containing protein, partial [Petrachloros mirabilis]
MSTQDFQQPINSTRYRWLPQLIILMNLVAFVAGVFILRNVEERLIAAAGEELTIAAAEVADKLDRLFFERYGDVQMMARAFALRSSDSRYLDSYLGWVKKNYSPVYLWLGVTDGQGVMVASTDSSLQGQNFSRSDWFRQAYQTRRIMIDDVAAHDGDDGIETVSFTAPILDAEGTFLGVVTTRVAMSVLEDVTIGTMRSLEERTEFTGPVAFQMVTKQGVIFVDSSTGDKGELNRQDPDLPSTLA